MTLRFCLNHFGTSLNPGGELVFNFLRIRCSVSLVLHICQKGLEYDSECEDSRRESPLFCGGIDSQNTSASPAIPISIRSAYLGSLVLRDPILTPAIPN
jgi:hypothetical protein